MHVRGALSRSCTLVSWVFGRFLRYIESCSHDGSCLVYVMWNDVFTGQIFNEKDACSAGDLISLRNVEVYVLARVVVLRVDLHAGLRYDMGNILPK